MKNKEMSHLNESAKIYRNYYKPSFNFLRLIKSILSVIFSGSSPSAGTYYRRK
ncbi:MAG TPA: hypothetical protein PLU37_04695 [Chitinophagaceae bacterium]|nr:hypothetical protein [Chitinophagaceae bacterium]MCB9055109.1 hypothetical protein [Chitinophagales bacterium]HPG10807.1 hypothetical protein [Chitinophagaceae bacterium]HRX94777.1 hypothetical protein [Chitinophagaceae bacterium]